MDFVEKNWLRIPLTLYALGLVVHNVYLSQFGNHEFELVQAKYILSGFGLIGFTAICVAYTSIKVNLSYIGDSFRLTKLLPWILRACSLPYVVYATLYSQHFYGHEYTDDPLLLATRAIFSIAHLVVFFSISDLIFMTSEGNGVAARMIRGIQNIISIPMVLATIAIAWNSPEFSGIVKATSYFFFGFIVIALYQADKKHGIAPKYLDVEAQEDHELKFQSFFGTIALFFMLWMVVTNYTKYIYPKIPVALGGSMPESVAIYEGNKKIEAELIQQSSTWILYINKETNAPEKIRSEMVDKIIYDTAAGKPNKQPKPTP